MWQLATAFAEIALRRRGPDSLPDSGFLIALVLGADFGVYLVECGFYGTLDPLGLLLYAVNRLLLFVFVYTVLGFFRFERRFRQTVTALIGIEVIISLCFLPIAALATLTGQDLLTEPFVLMRIGFLFWAIYIGATIFARSLNQTLLVGLGFEILYLCIYLFISSMLTPDVSALESPSV